MGYLVGTDEAGYGPNLGPLVVSATVWQAPGDPCEADLYKLLRNAVSATPPKSPAAKSKRVSVASGAATVAPVMKNVVWADSKTLYQSGAGLGALETGLLAALGLCSARPATWHDAWQALDPLAAGLLDRLPWHLNFTCGLPVHADETAIDALAARLPTAMEQAGVRLLAVRSRAVFPEEWNELLDEHGNKCTVLSVLTLKLLAEKLAELNDEPVAVICDKHGGRNSYQALLQQHVADYLVEVYAEGPERSTYQWGPSERRTQVEFCTKAERYLPTALASMASKYLRELAMLAFNDFWARNVPDLKPTAGYPLDARRFKVDIAAVQAGLAIDDRVLWRNR
ncbi:MAG TPA: hypothetical protein VMV10_15950 [Pirellulales bacterium]|nr:hypothetical protein [Pirellulales bacterium]